MSRRPRSLRDPGNQSMPHRCRHRPPGLPAQAKGPTLPFTFTPPVLMSPRSLGSPAAVRSHAAGPPRALRAGSPDPPSPECPPSGGARRCQAGRRGRGSLSSRSYLQDRLGVIKSDPPYVLGELAVGSRQVLRGGAQLTVCRVDLHYECVVGHRLHLSSTPACSPSPVLLRSPPALAPCSPKLANNRSGAEGIRTPVLRCAKAARYFARGIWSLQNAYKLPYLPIGAFLNVSGDSLGLLHRRYLSCLRTRSGMI